MDFALTDSQELIKKETAATHGQLVGEIQDRTLELTPYSPNRALIHQPASPFADALLDRCRPPSEARDS